MALDTWDTAGLDSSTIPAFGGVDASVAHRAVSFGRVRNDLKSDTTRAGAERSCRQLLGKERRSHKLMTNDNPVDGAQPLAGLIDYQDGSVVSRALLSKATGNVTLFAFDKDQGLSEHTAPHDALVLSIDGELDIKLEGDTHKLSRGEVILMPANKPHAVHAKSRSKMLLVMIRE